MLENVLPVFIKIYFDAGLKELASEHHRGATLKVLTECSKFDRLSVCHVSVFCLSVFISVTICKTKAEISTSKD
jgi:hypothetical protein